MRPADAPIRQLREPRWIDPLEIRLIGPSHPIAKDVLAIHQTACGPKTSPIRWSGSRLGNLYFFLTVKANCLTRGESGLLANSLRKLSISPRLVMVLALPTPAPGTAIGYPVAFT